MELFFEKLSINFLWSDSLINIIFQHIKSPMFLNFSLYTYVKETLIMMMMLRDIPVAIIVELVVGWEGEQRAKTRAQGEEDLRGSINPDLWRNHHWEKEAKDKIKSPQPSHTTISSHWQCGFPHPIMIMIPISQCLPGLIMAGRKKSISPSSSLIYQPYGKKPIDPWDMISDFPSNLSKFLAKNWPKIDLDLLANHETQDDDDDDDFWRQGKRET